MPSEILVAPVTAFLEDYGPSPEAARLNVEDCKDYLRGRGLLQGNVWRDLPMLAPKPPWTEPVSFAPFEDIVNAVWEYANTVEGKKRNNYHFKVVSSDHLSDSLEDTDNKMDACVLEATFHGKLPTHLILVPFRFKFVSKEIQQPQVSEQAVSDCQRILYEDPRRMFIFGATVEDGHFSLWYFSRSHSVKTQAINWMGEGLDEFIRVILSLAYARPSDLGIDPHVFVASRQESDQGQQYVYELDAPNNSSDTLPEPTRLNTCSSSVDEGPAKVYYRTVRARGPVRRARISGRATRIWEVVQIASEQALPEPDAEHFILKDVWLDVNSDTEVENQTKIFKAIDDFVEEGLKTFTGPDGIMDLINSDTRFEIFSEEAKRRLAGLLTNKEYRNLFLTKLVEWKGALTKERSEAARRPEESPFVRAHATGKKADSPSHANNIAAMHQPERMQQARFVYKEVCTAIYELPTFGDVFGVVRQALDALQILFCAGWVHRDVSAGNILALPVVNRTGQTIGWKVKLADLEFSQKFGHSTNPEDTRTGTPFFMPVEIMKKEYLSELFYIDEDMEMYPSDTLASQFKLSASHPDYKHYLRYRRNHIMAPLTRPFADAVAKYNKPGSVTHNYQHDLESLWWVMLYFITACADHQDSEEYARTIFRGKLKAGPREAVLDHFIDNVLVRKLHDLLKRPFLGPMETLRATLYEQYIQRVIFGHLNVDKSYSYIHAEFAEQLDWLLEDETAKWMSLPVANLMRADSTFEAHLPFGSTQ